MTIYGVIEDPQKAQKHSLKESCKTIYLSQFPRLNPKFSVPMHFVFILKGYFLFCFLMRMLCDRT